MQTYVRRKNRDKKVNEIDHFIPPNSHPKQPRSSSLSKPHTDFSVFLFPSIPNLPHHQQESAGSKAKLPTLAESSPDEEKDTEAGILDLPLDKWTQSKRKRKVVQSSKSNVDAQRTGTSTLEFLPEKSTITMSGDVCLTPGSVVWAKKAPHMWWPAEVLALNSCTEGTGGLVLVHYYGSEKSGWIDPARDLSPFEDCFEERSCNPSEEFQEALKQAIHQKKQLSSTKQLIASPKGHACLNVQDQSHDSWNSINSKIENGYMKKERSKRQRKPKVHFDEVNVPSKSVKSSRRLRIMRSLGLAPPVGSPFVQSPMQE